MSKIACQIDVFSASALPEMMLRAFLTDDEDARRNLEALSMALKKIENKPGYCLCFMCDNHFDVVGDVAMWAMMTPMRMHGVEEVIASGICWECSEQPKLLERIVQRYKDTIAPGFEVHSVMPMAGHA